MFIVNATLEPSHSFRSAMLGDVSNVTLDQLSQKLPLAMRNAEPDPNGTCLWSSARRRNSGPHTRDHVVKPRDSLTRVSAGYPRGTWSNEPSCSPPAHSCQ